MIDQNARARGWLIFATHDVRETPSRFGCTPDFFEQVVQWSLESGARILPVVEALEVLKASQPKQEGMLRDAARVSLNNSREARWGGRGLPPPPLPYG